MSASILLQSFSLVALAEIGDKTQLLSILLAARYGKFWPILAGVFVATLLNHALVAWAGSHAGNLLNPDVITLIASLLFIAIGLWVLIPDKEPDIRHATRGAFMASAIAFFFAEMGDKTQIATLTLGARYEETMQIIIGTTLGMLAANAPAIWFGDTLMKRIPLKAARITACVMFIGFGLAGLLSWYLK